MSPTDSPLRLTTPQPQRHPAPSTRAQALSHLIFVRPDLDRAEAFLADFGLITAGRDADALYMRGTGPAPYCYMVRRGAAPAFAGFGFDMASKADLTTLSRLPGASAIEAVDSPGGGWRVVLTDPSGFRVEAVCGREPVPPLPHRPPLVMNLAGATPRINDTQRPPVAPPEIVRLGHVVLDLADYQATAAWYTRHFGLIPSDVQVLPDGAPAVAFLRLDRGAEPVDHHTLALVQGFMPAFNHAAFEVVDADAVGMGNRVLRDRGWRHAWGIGRHVLGSQIFDYWQDPWDSKHEHYCDGDVFTADRPTGIHAVSRAAMSQWGPVMPVSFTRPKPGLRALVALVRNLRRSPDLSLSKLRTLARLFG